MIQIDGLKVLEAYRGREGARGDNFGSFDVIIRVCEAHIANLCGFRDRSDWAGPGRYQVQDRRQSVPAADGEERGKG